MCRGPSQQCNKGCQKSYGSSFGQQPTGEGLLGILDDFLGIVYRTEGGSAEELFKRGQISASAFDVALIK